MELVIIRGLPGSGKSTLAKELVGHKHFEADQYHMTENGYVFDAKNISKAHSQCMINTYNALYEGADVVVSNTFTRVSEMQAYFDMAEEFMASVKVIEAKGTYQNVHAVPPPVIEAMRLRWEPTPAQYL